MKINELALEGDPHPSLREGAILRLEPVIGVSGKVAAYRVMDDRDGKEIMVVPASSEKVGRS
jgi:hypothetical protein